MSAAPNVARANLARERELHARMTPALRAEIVRLALLVTRKRTLAEDAAQDALIELWRHPEALDAQNHKLLRRIVRTRALNVLRAERRYKHYELLANVKRAEDVLVDD